MNDLEKKKKWAVVGCEGYVGANGKLQWTTDKKEAEMIAISVGGRVVDAEAFVAEQRKKIESEEQGSC